MFCLSNIIYDTQFHGTTDIDMLQLSLILHVSENKGDFCLRMHKKSENVFSFVHALPLFIKADVIIIGALFQPKEVAGQLVCGRLCERWLPSSIQQ